MRIKAAAALLLACTLPAASGPAPRWDAPGALNPILPGYFADPSIVHDGNRWYIFATIDPWGGEKLGLWQSDDGRNWTFSTPDWPTKTAAASPTSSKAMVWAPSVVKAHGAWWMFVSVGSEVWVGTAPSPGGPWREANGGKPLIPAGMFPDYHMIDAEAFVDDDGQAYLAWGSGINWKNGHCFVVKLKPDMISFDGEPRDVTPANYFEAPFLFKANGRYFLTYSDGNTTTDTYKVRYAVGDSPMGPFTEAANSPILTTNADRTVISPGHHAIFRSQGRPYILYHRQALPFPRPGKDVLRQTVVDELVVKGDRIERVTATHGGPVAGFARQRTQGLKLRIDGAGAAAADDNYATLWRPAAGDPATIVADLGTVRRVTRSRLRPEFADRDYSFTVEASDDGQNWKPIARQTGAHGSPLIVDHPTSARYVRLSFTGPAALWEWAID